MDQLQATWWNACPLGEDANVLVDNVVSNEDFPQNIVSDDQENVNPNVGPQKRNLHVSTIVQRLKVIKWMEDTISQRGHATHIFSKTAC